MVDGHENEDVGGFGDCHEVGDNVGGVGTDGVNNRFGDHIVGY